MQSRPCCPAPPSANHLLDTAEPLIKENTLIHDISPLQSTFVVRVQFGNLETFCAELAARGPNLEPVVRICQQVRRGQDDTRGPLPVEHVFGHVTYVRRTADVLQLTMLHLFLGQRWAYADAMPDRAEVQARIDQLYDRIRDVCQRLGYTLVDGSTYQEPGAQP